MKGLPPDARISPSRTGAPLAGLVVRPIIARLAGLTSVSAITRRTVGACIAASAASPRSLVLGRCEACLRSRRAG